MPKSESIIALRKIKSCFEEFPLIVPWKESWFEVIEKDIDALKILIIELNIKVYVNKDGRKMLSAMGKDMVDYTNLPERFERLKEAIENV